LEEKAEIHRHDQHEIVKIVFIVRKNNHGETWLLLQAWARYLNHHPRFARVCILKSSPHTPE
jgi:hypothetical protein